MLIKVLDTEVELIRKNIKNMHLYVMRPDGKIRVSAPLQVSEDKIRSFILSRLDWIKKHREEILAEPKAVPLTYSSGEVIYVFGEPYSLEVAFAKKSSFSFFDGKALLVCKENASVEQRERIVDASLRLTLSQELESLFAKWEKITSLHPSQYRIKKMKTRWGTCNTNTKTIWLNLALVHAKRECIEYVIMHELAHLRVANHGKDFIALMDKYMPSWKNLREELNKK